MEMQPLKSVVSYNDDTLPESTDVSTPIRYLEISDVSETEGIRSVGEITFGEAPSRARRVLRCGDVVVSTVRTYLRAVAGVHPEHDGLIASTGFAVLRARRVDERFLKYAVLDRDFMDQVVARSTGVSYPAINASDLVRIQIPVPPRATQRTVADYLDRETSQIDAFVAKNVELIALLAERLGRVVDDVMAELGFAQSEVLAISQGHPLPEPWRIIPLGSLLNQLTNGYVGPTRDILVEDGIRYIQGTHIKGGKIDFARRPFYVSKRWHDERPRIHLREGDVLIVQTGDIGKVAVVPADFGEASCHALQIARVNRSIVDPQFLGAYLSSQFGYHQLKSRATGALHLHLEASIKSAPVVVPPLPVQVQIVDKVRQRRLKIDEAIATAEKMIALSKERRAALISAAVSGKIDVGVAA